MALIMNKEYSFFLNEFTDIRFSICTNCKKRTFLRKIPLVVHLDPHYLHVINMSCKLCENCKILVINKDKIVPLIKLCMDSRKVTLEPDFKFVIMGHLDKKMWRICSKTQLEPCETLNAMYKFKQELKLEQRPY